MSNSYHRIKNIVMRLTCTLLISLSGLAQTTEVSDEQLQNQLRNIEDFLNNRLYPTQSQQTESLRSMNQTIKQSLSGSGGVGGSNNFATEQKFRNWTPSAADLANMVQQGLQTGSLADQISYYNQKYQIPTAEQLTPNNPHNPLTEHAIFSAVTTNGALSIADKSFDNVPQLLEQINALYRQIDQQQTSKQAQDLNSVILLKIAALQIDLIRLQSQQLKMQAVSNAQENSKRAYMQQFVENIKE